MRQHFARSRLVPLLLSALLSGSIAPASASGDVICKDWDGQTWSCKDPPDLGKGYDETCKGCQNCVYDGQTWSCEDPPGLADNLDCVWENGQWTCVDLAKRRKEVLRNVVGYVRVYVLPLGVAYIMFLLFGAHRYYCERCNSRYGMRRPRGLERETDLGTVKWVCKYCGYVRYQEQPPWIDRIDD